MNQELKIKDKGFTLIELLVVMVVAVFVGTIIGSILFSSLRGTNKTNALTVVRQNGNYALTQMSKMIRDAKSLNSPCSPSSASISITSFDNESTTFSCPVASPFVISSNSAKLTDENSVSVSSCSFTCTQSTISGYPIIGVFFTLSTLTGQVQEKTASIPFQTSITMRNVGR